VDAWPQLVADFEARTSTGASLLEVFTQHVGHMARSYPDAYFVLGRKDDDSVADLSHRAFTVCAKVEKGRFPFSGRRPFAAYVAEAFEGRAIRYHSFYAKLSIAREILRDDYAKNLVRDPVLRARAELYKAIGDVLKEVATASPGGRGSPPRWRVGGPALVRPPEVVEAELRRRGLATLADQVPFALRHGGPASQAQLARLLGPLHRVAEPDELGPTAHDPGDVALTLSLREAVLDGWAALGEEDRGLLAALARGASYDELIATDPRFAHRVAVTRAVKRITNDFVARVEAVTGGNSSTGSPLMVLESILGVLSEVADLETA